MRRSIVLLVLILVPLSTLSTGAAHHVVPLGDFVCTSNGEASAFRCPWWDGGVSYAGLAPCQSLGVEQVCASHAPRGYAEELDEGIHLASSIPPAAEAAVSEQYRAAMLAVLHQKSELWLEDSASGRDAGDTIHDAVPVVPGAYSGSLTPWIDRMDWYSIDVPAGHAISIDATGDVGLVYDVVSPDGSALSWYTGSNVFRAQPAGVWSIGFWLPEPHLVEYHWSLELLVPQDDDGGSGRDAWSGEPVIIEEGTYAGSLGTLADRADVYGIHAGRGDIVRVALDADPGTNFTLRDPSGLYEFKVTEAGLQNITVHQIGPGEGGYRIEVDITPFVQPPGVWDIEITELNVTERLGGATFEVTVRNAGDLTIETSFDGSWGVRIRHDPATPWLDGGSTWSYDPLGPGESQKITWHETGFVEAGEKTVTFSAFMVAHPDADPSNDERSASVCYHVCGVSTPP